MTYNVALIVLDTLREDYSKGLEKLREKGFVQYKNAIAPAPWTIPSHASMFTGLMPSEHGIHSNEEIFYKGFHELARISRLKMHKVKHGILGEFSRHGYTTLIVTANPFITPYYGFKADDVIYVNRLGWQRWNQGVEDIPTLGQMTRLITNGQVSRIIRWILYIINFFLNPKDKGGKFMINYLNSQYFKKYFDKPFFLFVNTMESHELYARREPFIFRKCLVNTIIDGKCPRECYYIASAYPRHAEYATSIALKIVDLLDDGNTLIVVTADHGQGLCDPGFGHSYWLTDPLLRVPLWVKFPHGKAPPQKGKYVPLTQIPDILRTALGENTTIGTNTAKAESFDLSYDYKFLRPMLKDEHSLSHFIEKVFTYRHVIFD
ncbi:MAG: sulfatase-like hydrolase/transferase [Pyrobaculum sp.]